jgi:hypothetical protein
MKKLVCYYWYSASAGFFFEMNSAAGDLKLVHYGKRTSPERMDRAAAVMQAILAYRNRNSSADKREEILRQIKDQSSGSGGGGGASAAA